MATTHHHIIIYSHKNLMYMVAHPKWSDLRPFNKKVAKYAID